VESTDIGAQALVMDRGDTVATLLDPVQPGDAVKLLDPELTLLKTVVACDSINPFHKIAVYPMARNESVIKFGEVIGCTSKTIAVGESVHVHNLRSAKV